MAEEDLTYKHLCTGLAAARFLLSPSTGKKESQLFLKYLRAARADLKTATTSEFEDMQQTVTRDIIKLKERCGRIPRGKRQIVTAIAQTFLLPPDITD